MKLVTAGEKCVISGSRRAVDQLYPILGFEAA